MFVSRMCSKVAVYSAAIVIAGAGFAHAAVLGGANVNVQGTVTTTVTEDPTQTTDGLFFIEATGTFFAQSLIQDPDALNVFELSTNFTAGGRNFFDIEVITPVTSVNELLGVVGTDFNEVVGLGAPIVGALLSGDQIGTIDLDDPFFGLFQGVDIGFEITDVDSTSNSIFGDFSVSTELTGTQLDVVEQTLIGIFGSINFEPEFAFEFNAEIAPIPLPAALPLFLSAFALLGFMGWRRKVVA